MALKSQYHANGKLLLTAEYLVLRGAMALALPLNKGQQLSVFDSKKPGLFWKAESVKGNWFDVEFDNALKIIRTDSQAHAERLQHILREAVQQKPSIIDQLQNKRVLTRLEFNPSWGWGSSSTLLHLLSQWLDIDAYRLLDKTFGGSGYDIACASVDHPIFYKRMPDKNPEITRASFLPEFIDQMGIVWLNQKQSSAIEVKNFLKSDNEDRAITDQISAISIEMSKTRDAINFASMMQEHEQLIARITGHSPVQNILFPDFPGTIKSLGAWGGDFILYISELSFHDASQWFKNKGYDTVMELKNVAKL